MREEDEPLLRWEALLLDCSDPVGLAPFWAAALQRTWHMDDDGDVVLPGQDEPGLLLQEVPDPPTVKDRWHVDLRPVGEQTPDGLVAELTALGARPADVGQRGDESWRVLSDPEGHVFCVLGRPGRRRFEEVVVDCADPERVGAFWAAALGWGRGTTYDEFPQVVELVPPQDRGPSLTFVPVAEAKAAKNRAHLDLRPVRASRDEAVERLLALGARRADVGQTGQESWVVLADVEGNEFCVLHA